MTTSNKRIIGSVKWFNHKAGFGFITICNNGDSKGKDIFVHYSAIRTVNKMNTSGRDKYKYLVQGEYVEFYISNASKGAHEYQAVDVTGILEGPIMCEVRRITVTRFNEDMNTTLRLRNPESYKDNDYDAEVATDDVPKTPRLSSNKQKNPPPMYIPPPPPTLTSNR
jgi:cold shock CspA family protein